MMTPAARTVCAALLFCCPFGNAFAQSSDSKQERASVSAKKFTLEKNDVVLFLGSEFTEQAIKHNYLEAELSLRWPNQNIRYRNLGWSGDTPNAIARGYFGDQREGSRRLQAELDRLKPTVVFLMYGMNAKPSELMDQFKVLFEQVKKRTTRIVIVSPPPAEKLDPPYPDPVSLNATRSENSAALQKFATERDVPFVDLFNELRSQMNANSSSDAAPITTDTIRFNSRGYRLIADLIIKELDLATTPRPQAMDQKRQEQLRRLIALKNRLYFQRYRPQNETYLRGFRKHEQGQNAKEIAEFDALIEQAESRVSALIQGKPLPEAIKEPPRHKLAFKSYSPKEERATFKMADELEISLFASEPMIANPIHMNFDNQGRLWVATSPIYPHIKPGATPRDQVVVLHDTDGDGKADKKTIFADDLLIPTAVLPDGKGGAFIANSTELLHMSDDDGDGRADRRRVVLAGFGTEDTHHIIHTLRWGPDGAMYFNQSIYIHTHMETPFGVRRLWGSGIWRFQPETGQAEIVMRGLVNPWGHIIDDWGQNFATDGAGGQGINYAFPGSVYTSAPGYSRILRGMNPGQPKLCGLEMVSGRHFPQAWRGTLVTNDFRGNRIARFQLSENGSGYTSRQLPDLMSSKHVAFRPVDVKMGPDGSLFVADWYNPIIQHGEVDFRDARRDYQHGRIWRVTVKDQKTVSIPKFKSASIEQLLEYQRLPEQWSRHQARLELKTRDPAKVATTTRAWTKQLKPSGDGMLKLEALWTGQAIGQIDLELVRSLLQDKDHRIRAAAVRILGVENKKVLRAIELLTKSINDTHPQVRLEAVSALRAVGTAKSVDVAMQAVDHSIDTYLEFAIWFTLKELEDVWLNPLLEGKLEFRNDVKKMMVALRISENPKTVEPMIKLLSSEGVSAENRRTIIEQIGEYGAAEHLKFLLELAIANNADRPKALEALVGAAVNKRRLPAGKREIPRQLFDHPATFHLAGLFKLDVHRKKITDAAEGIGSTTLEIRRRAIQGTAAYGAVDVLVSIANSDTPPEFRVLAIRELVRMDLKKAALAAATTLKGLGSDGQSDGSVAAIVDAFVQRRNGAAELAKVIANQSFNQRVVDGIARRAGSAGRGGKPLVDAMRSVKGFVSVNNNLSPEEMKTLIAEVEEKGDPSRGETIYHRKELNCITCHAIGGAGGVVGPDLLSLGASSPVDYIVDSMLEPNKKIKEGYHTTRILTFDGTQVSGKLISETATRVTIRDANAKQHVFQVDDIDERTNSNVSLMPADLVSKLDRNDLVDLISFMSKLGKEGNFKTPAGKFVRRWALNDGSVVFSRVDGSLVVGETKPKTVTAEIEVNSAGQIGVRVGGPAKIKLVVDQREAVDVVEKHVVELAKGKHRLTFLVDDQKSIPLTVELYDVANSKGVAVPVNQ